jgi:hypothetical protein
MNARQDFWSRRKQGVEAEAEAEIAEQVAVEEAQTQEELEAQSDEEILEELGLQDPDTMKAGDDFSAFMAKAVPTRLRNRALRELWLSNPALANLDALLDYGEDFTKSERAIEDFQTTYQVGKGLLAHVQEMARQEEAAKQAADGPEEEVEEIEEIDNQEEEVPEALALVEEETDTETDTETEADTEVTADVDGVVVTRDDILGDEVIHPPKKRMRFNFEAQV